MAVGQHRDHVAPIARPARARSVSSAPQRSQPLHAGGSIGPRSPRASDRGGEQAEGFLATANLPAWVASSPRRKYSSCSLNAFRPSGGGAEVAIGDTFSGMICPDRGRESQGYPRTRVEPVQSRRAAPAGSAPCLGQKTGVASSRSIAASIRSCKGRIRPQEQGNNAKDRFSRSNAGIATLEVTWTSTPRFRSPESPRPDRDPSFRPAQRLGRHRLKAAQEVPHLAQPFASPCSDRSGSL